MLHSIRLAKNEAPGDVVLVSVSIMLLKQCQYTGCLDRTVILIKVKKQGYNVDFHQLGHVCLSVCAIGCSFFRGLSLALRSHDQFEACDWSTLLHYQT